MIEVLIALIIISGLIQLYWLYLQLKSFEKKSKSNGNKSVSVVIASNNELQNLKTLIPVLLKQNYNPYWEIIVALDRSSDGSSEYLKKLQKDFPKLRYFEQSKEDIPSGASPKKIALMKAIQLSQYPLILQTDADCYPKSENWISEMTSSLAKDDVFVVGLSAYEKRKGLLNQIIQFDTAWTAGSMIYFAGKGRAYMSLGRNQLFDKASFFKKGGYANKLKIPFGDDDLLIQNLNPEKKCSICVTNDGQTVSIPEKSWADWLNQKRRHLMAGNYYSNKILKELILNYLTIPFYIFLILLLILFSHTWLLCLAIFLTRSAVYAYVFSRIAVKGGSEINIVLLPLLDLLHICINLALGLSTKLRKNIEWR